MRYIEIEHVVYGEPLDFDLVDQLLELELIDARREAAQRILIAEHDCEEFRAMLRLMVDLQINPPGVATIMHMRRRIQELQTEVRQLRKRLK
jgi:hypothetical protein